MRTRVKKNTECEMLTMGEGFNKFIISCECKNLSPKTINYYKKEFDRFSIYYTESHFIKTLSQDIVNGYILYLQSESKANDITIASYMRGVRAFCYYFMKNGWCNNFEIVIPKATKKIKETYTDGELAILTKKPDFAKCTFTEEKTWLFECFLLATGCRLSTALNLQVKDVDFDNNVLKLTKTKNRKQQIIPMAINLKKMLKEYIMQYRADDDELVKPSGEKYVFCNDYGLKATNSTYENNVRRYNHARGVERTSIHAFRHTFAKNYIKSGGDAFRLQQILGHSDLTMTREYVNMYADDLSDNFTNLNALDKMFNTKIKKR